MIVPPNKFKIKIWDNPRCCAQSSASFLDNLTYNYGMYICARNSFFVYRKLEKIMSINTPIDDFC